MDILRERNREIKNNRAQQTKQTVIKKSFTNLLFVSIAEKLAYFFNPFIDSAIVGVFLDSSIQAAMGYFVADNHDNQPSLDYYHGRANTLCAISRATRLV